MGHGEVPPADLEPHPRAWRRHPKSQADALTEVLTGIGWIAEVIVNRRTGRLVDGAFRAELATSRGEPTVPVVYVDLTDEGESAVTHGDHHNGAECRRP